MKENMLDSLPDKIKYERARGPREQDIVLVEKWLGVNKAKANSEKEKGKSEKRKGKKKK